MCKQPFELSDKRASRRMALVQSDLCQMDALSLGDAKYFMTMLDDHSRKIFLYLLKSKDEVSTCISHFITEMDRKYGLKIQTLRTDNGTEYVNNTVNEILKKSGITHQTSIAYNPQQNGRAERINRTLLDKVGCMLIESDMHKKFWGEAIMTAAYIHNRSPKKSLNYQTPEEVWTGTKPDLSHMRTFGCKAHVYIPNHKRGKLDPKRTKCIMLGYCTNQKGYRLWDPTKQRVIAARDVVFYENPLFTTPDVVFLPLEHTEKKFTSPKPTETAPAKQNDHPHNPETVHNDQHNSPEELQANQPNSNDKHTEVKKGLPQPNPKNLSSPDASSSDEQLEQLQLRRSQRPKKKNRRYDDHVLYQVTSNFNKPRTFEEAISGPEKEQWWKAMRSEYSSIVTNNTWTLKPLPSGHNLIGSKWVFKRKTSADGKTRYKARLVAKGYAQIKGVDYDDTYSPVVRFTTLRILFAFAARERLDVYHLDVETAFLHGTLEETVYLEPMYVYN